MYGTMTLANCCNGTLRPNHRDECCQYSRPCADKMRHLRTEGQQIISRIGRGSTLSRSRIDCFRAFHTFGRSESIRNRRRNCERRQRLMLILECVDILQIIASRQSPTFCLYLWAVCDVCLTHFDKATPQKVPPATYTTSICTDGQSTNCNIKIYFNDNDMWICGCVCWYRPWSRVFSVVCNHERRQPNKTWILNSYALILC